MTVWFLLITFFKIGAFTFGGGYAMLPMIQQEVLAHQWMTEAELINFIAISESTPGSFAINVATYVGMHVGGLAGAFSATLGVILPGFLVILFIAKGMAAFQKSQVVRGMLTGLRPAVVGLIAAAVLSVAVSVFTLSKTLYPLVISAAILVVTLYFLFVRRTHPILLLLLAAGIGILAGMAGLWN